MYYTIGQRQGLGIGGRKDSDETPWYVAEKVLASNTLVVVQGEHPLLYSDELIAGDAHWIGPKPEALIDGGALRCKVKLRYRQPDQDCSVRAESHGKIRVMFDAAQRAVAPGQYAVFYQGDRCLGGAVIERTCARSRVLAAAM